MATEPPTDPGAVVAEADALGQAGDHAGALRLYDRALALSPAHAPAHQGRGGALFHLGRIEEALAAFDAALAIRPDWADARLNRGAALRRLGRLDEALAAYDALLRLHPNAAAVRANRGNVLMDLGRANEALAEFEAALAAQPDSALAHNNRGNALLSLARHAEALAAFEAALALKPDYPTACYNRGVALMELDRPAEALAAFDAALALAPGYVDAHNNRGHALLDLQRHAEALESFRAAIRLAPDPRDFQANYRGVLRRIGEVEAALADADAALARDPGSGEARFSRALALLTLGRFEAGWADYEHRLEAKTFLASSAGPLPPALRPRLARGIAREDLAGRRVLLLAEQGIGDIVMFASMVPDVAALAAETAFAAEPRLARLFAASFPGVRILDPAQAVREAAAFDLLLPVGSLGRLFRNRREDFPGTPYLAPDAQTRRRWAGRLGPRRGRLRVGLSWRGGVRATGRADRSVPLAELAAPLAAAGCELVSLQYGEVEAEIAAAGAPIRRFPAAETDDFAELAGLALACDVVVSVQTALVHLSGAVGAPALVMVPFAPEWRYASEATTMPWYRSVTLIRQAEDRVWAPVIRQVVDRLPAKPQ